ncbi:PREDICTED: TAR DNA-binding protein 43-like [Myotis brandtii]|uniref:TAR DNA-binding protein 43-like n=1 Tax=Myotis brandtii TaxID=109478 RepID=UPI0003BBE833|nr:PREDICTED: TAR DNA-binding protein 43-like [Myotis brandtii]
MDALTKAISKLNLKLPEGFRIEASKTEHIPGKMFIGGLSRNTSKEALFDYLSQYGKIIDFTIKTHPETGVSRGFGFVLFEDKAAVERVLQVKEHQVEGRKFELRKAQAMELKFPPRKVFVGGVNPKTPEDKIRQYFGTFGEIEHIELPVCPKTNKRRSFCFITYTDEIPVRKLLETRFHLLGSRPCEVKIAVVNEIPKMPLRRGRDIPFPKLDNASGGGEPPTKPNAPGAGGVNQSVCGACGVDPNAHGVIRVDSNAYGAVTVDQNASGAIAVDQNASGAIAVDQNASGAIAVDQNASGAIAVDQNASGAIAVDPNACGAIRVNPNVYGAVAVDPNVYGAVAVNPNVYGAVAVNPNVYGAVAVNPNVYGAVAVDPNVYGAVAVDPNVYGAFRVNRGVYRASGDMGNPSMVLAPVHISPCNQGYNYSDQAYGPFYNAYSNQPIFNSYNGREHFVGCNYGTQPIGTALANYNVQLNQVPVFSTGYQGIYQPF